MLARRKPQSAQVDSDGYSECFGAVIDHDTVASWRSRQDQLQVIGQAELFPLLAARLTWRARLADRRVIYFLDNDSARIAAVRAYSPVLASLKIVMGCTAWDFEHRSSAWYARVPTVCNVADAPSRMTLRGIPGCLRSRVVPPVLPHGASPAEILEIGFSGAGDTEVVQ